MQTLTPFDSHAFTPDTVTSRSGKGEDTLSEGARLFAETIAAHGGEDFLRLQTLRLTGKGEFTTPPQTGGLKVPLAAFTYYIATDGRSRLEARSPGGPITFVVRGLGKGGFMVLAGRSFPLPPEQTDDLELTEFLRNAVRQGYPVTVGTDGTPEIASDGKSLLRYDVHRATGGVTGVFVESDTKRVRKLVTESPRGEMTILASEYRMVSGLPIFGQLQLLENRANVIKLTVSEVTLDEPLKDALFEKP